MVELLAQVNPLGTASLWALEGYPSKRVDHMGCCERAHFHHTAPPHSRSNSPTAASFHLPLVPVDCSLTIYLIYIIYTSTALRCVLLLHHCHI